MKKGLKTAGRNPWRLSKETAKLTIELGLDLATLTEQWSILEKIVRPVLISFKTRAGKRPFSFSVSGVRLSKTRLRRGLAGTVRFGFGLSGDHRPKQLETTGPSFRAKNGRIRFESASVHMIARCLSLQSHFATGRQGRAGLSEPLGRLAGWLCIAEMRICIMTKANRPFIRKQLDQPIDKHHLTKKGLSLSPLSPSLFPFFLSLSLSLSLSFFEPEWSPSNQEGKRLFEPSWA